jgi:hypothetical protein
MELLGILLIGHFFIVGSVDWLFPPSPQHGLTLTEHFAHVGYFVCFILLYSA